MADLKGKLAEVNEQISSTRSEAQTEWQAFEQARDEFAKAEGDVNSTDSEAFKRAEEAHKLYATKSQELGELEAVRDGIFAMLGNEAPVRESDPKPAAASREALPTKALGDRVLESEGYAALAASGVLESERRTIGNVQLAEMTRGEIKAALLTGASDTSAGAFVVNDQKGYVPQPRRPLRVLDLITIGDTDSDTVEYARQTAFTNVAAETAESTDTTDGSKPEATIAFEKVTAAVKTIAHWVPATRRALRDAGQLRTIIESQLRYGLDLRLENQVVAGNGSGENLTGIVNTSGILTQAMGSDTAVDAIHKAITQIRLGYVEPNGVGLHPNDWQDIRLSKNSAGDYYYGPPALAGSEMVWGLPVAVTPAFSSGTGVVGDYRQATLWLREVAQILASDSHSDFFVKNLVAILAEMAAAFGVQMPAAFAKVTGI